jgi:hypothetical protein
MKLHELVSIVDSGIAKLLRADGYVSSYRQFPEEKSVVETKNWVSVVLRERGKIVGRREGYNVWTNTGREYNAMLQSYSAMNTPFRSDRLSYMGAGVGAQIETPGVTSLAVPMEFVVGQFLAPLDTPPTFPLTPSRTTVRYRRTFLERELTTTAGSKLNISEFGLFTDGSAPGYAPGSRDISFATAPLQAPMAYKTFEPIGKTDTMQLEVDWEVRF